MKKNEKRCLEKEIQLLSRKISKEYVSEFHEETETSSPADKLRSAYIKAKELFDPSSDNSIFSSTLQFYLNNINEALDAYAKDLTSFESLVGYLNAFIKVQAILNDSVENLKTQLSEELILNKDYYSLFDIDYYLELVRSNNLNTALAELENDVNIRAVTYYNAAYKDYSDILPGLYNILAD